MKFLRLLIRRALTALLLCAAAGFSAQAQTWPTRSIVLIIAYPVGSTVDLVGRAFADFTSKELGQTIIVENRPGGGGVVAGIGISKATPDGYTILLQAIGPMILRPIMDPSVGYDPVKDFSPIVLLGDVPNVILGGADFAPRTVRELVDWAKKNPGQMTVGHPGIGTMGHLAAALLASNAGITANYIGYQGNAQMLLDLMGGRIDIGVVAYGAQMKIARIMAVMTPEPVESVPGVPSMKEAGFPGVYASTWYAVFGPANMPAAIVEKLNTAVNTFLRSDDAKKKFETLGLRILGGSAGQLATKMAEDKVQWSKVIKDADIKMNDQK